MPRVGPELGSPLSQRCPSKFLRLACGGNKLESPQSREGHWGTTWSLSPQPELRPRLCAMKKGPNGYGFNLHSDKSRPGQFIRAVDASSPAEASGLRAQDRIVEVRAALPLSSLHTSPLHRPSLHTSPPQTLPF